jgi:hypothetical protein
MSPYAPARFALCALAVLFAVPASEAASAPGSSARAAHGGYRAGYAAAPVHRIGHHRSNYHRHRWSGSAWLSAPWVSPWYGPSLSIGYGSRHFGAVIPLLPLGYQQLWIDGEPVYTADDVYYVRVPGGYRVVERPEGEHHVDAGRRDGPTPSYVKNFKSPTDELVITPGRGQSLTQRSFDRIDCERAAIAKTGYEPSSAGEGALKKAEWVKEVSSCLVAKGYAVK